VGTLRLCALTPHWHGCATFHIALPRTAARRGATHRHAARRCPRAEIWTLSHCAWEPAKRPVMVWNRSRMTAWRKFAGGPLAEAFPYLILGASVSFLSPRAREGQCLPADPARSALARSLRTSDL
jgi:hypothetical protein